MDLNRSIMAVLLTSRIQPTRANEATKAFRPVLHDAVMKGLCDKGSKVQGLGFRGSLMLIDGKQGSKLKAKR